MENCSDLYSLYWNNHTRNLKSAFDVFRCDNELVDVTLSCEGRKIKAHKIVLSACSLYFLDLFRDNPCQHPIIILRDVKYHIMVDILNFMYQGEVNVAFEHLNIFLKTAELLQVKGLVNIEKESCMSSKFDKETIDNETHKNSNSKLDNQTDYNNFKENNVPLSIVSAELENDNEMEVVPQTSFKKEVDIDVFTENNSTEYMDINIRNNLSSNGDGSNKSLERENLEGHFEKSLNNAHNKEPCFPCRFCDKVFSHPNSLKLHLPKHTGSTSCALCQAVLSRKYELKVHMRKKHNIELY